MSTKGYIPDKFWGIHKICQKPIRESRWITLYRLVSSADLQSDWNQIRPNKMSALIWIQSVLHSDGIPERIFRKSWFWKKSVGDKKARKILQGADLMNNLLSHQLFCLFCCFTSMVNSYGHGGMVSSPNHTFFWASLNKQLTSTSCTYFRL